MKEKEIVILVLFGLGFVVFGAIIYILFSKKRNSNLDTLLRSSRYGDSSGGKVTKEIRDALKDDNEDLFEQLKEQQKRTIKRGKEKVSIEDKYYHAGYLTEESIRKFKTFKIFFPIVSVVIFSCLTYYFLGLGKIYLGVLGGLSAGISLPGFYLDKKIAKRSEEILYYLPLVIEQIAIGVSSSLDIGPCLQRIIKMADERDTHNVVTELIQHAEQYIRSGVSLEEALTEIGIKSGHTELKHSFMALGQVAKHGGEITHQLHELANAVSTQRETMIEARIKKLELKATGPVAFVFLGFMITLMAGLMIKIKDMF